MVNPAMFGVSPQQMEMAKQVGQHLRMQITKYPREGKLEVRYVLVDPNDSFDMRMAIDQLAEQLAYGHDMMFDMKGMMVTVE